MKKLFTRFLLAFGVTVSALGILVLIEYVGGQPMGLFSGSRPQGLGFNGGQFKPPTWKPNTVSSTVAKDASHYIAPLAFTGESEAAWKKLVSVVKSTPRINVVSEKTDYLYAESKSAGLGFVDDLEFAIDAKANIIHVRSGSRLGVRDFDVNRKRVEAIRAAFAR
jgi:uncharacterized protein (DUF1499 family)